MEVTSRTPNGLHAALSLFTALPVPPLAMIDRTTARRAAHSMWLVGGLLGVACGGIALGLDQLGAAPFLRAICYLALLAAATGALHLDGLADTADGLGSRKPPADALTIMRKSDIGPFGVATLVLTLLLQAAALSELAAGWRGFLLAATLAPLFGRLTIMRATSAVAPMARSSGFGALFGGVTPVWHARIAEMLLVAGGAGAGWALGGWHGALVAGGAGLAGLLVAASWRRHLIRRLTGMTGDTYGSLIEVTATTVLLVFAVCWHVG